MKIAGILLVIAASTSAGVIASTSLSRRVRSLEAISLMIDSIKTHIVYLRSPVDTIMDAMSMDERFRDLTFIGRCRDFLREGTSFETAWESAIERESKNIYLKKNDLAVLTGLSKIIGAVDVDGQVAGLSLTGSLIDKRLEDAREKSGKYGRLYRSLGLFAGILTAIFLV